MKRALRLILGLGMAAAVGIISTGARADTFVWKDPKGGFTASFPDSWTLQTADNPDTRLRIAGPIADDRATCSVKVATDGRLKIYPKKYMDEAVGEKLNREFWEHETGQFLNAEIRNFYGPASLGDKGDATAIHVAYRAPDGSGKTVPMFGVMVASVYGDKLYIASCGARHEAFEKYAPVFGSILDSIQLDDRYNPFYTGYYRNFLLDPKLKLPRSKPGSDDATLFVYDYGRGYNN